MLWEQHIAGYALRKKLYQVSQIRMNIACALYSAHAQVYLAQLLPYSVKFSRIADCLK